MQGLSKSEFFKQQDKKIRRTFAGQLSNSEKRLRFDRGIFQR